MAKRSSPSVVIFKYHHRKFRYLRRALAQSKDCEAIIRNLIQEPLSPEQESKILPERNARRSLQIVLATYIIRLNDPTTLRTASAMKKVLKRYGIAARDHHKVIGVPIRKSDKCKAHESAPIGEMLCVNTTIALEHARRIAFAAPSITHVLLTSEDESAISSEYEKTGKGQFVKLEIMRNFLDLLPESGGPNKRQDKSNAQLLEAMLITLHLQAFPSYHVLTPRSTFHSLIAAQSKAVIGKRNDMIYPLGTFRDLRNSAVFQIMR